jgi:membrane protein
MIRKFQNFINRDLWRFHARKVRTPREKAIRALRIFILSFREFTDDQCSLRASALTVYSLLSIVPVFAMAFGLAKGFGLDKLLQEKLMESLKGQQVVLEHVIEFSQNLLQNTKGGVIAGVGIALLFWSVIQVLSNIENSFNYIWGIKKQRTLSRKFTDYLSLMLIVPVAFVVASSATVFIASQISSVSSQIVFIGPVILTLLQLLPFAVFWGLLTYLYMFMPNGKIHFTSALLGGMVAGTVYQAVQWVYIKFQIGASNAGAVYGTFAALPLFLAWLHTSWLIVLYGAELAFAHQNEERFEFEQDCKNAKESFKKMLALRMMQMCVTRFIEGGKPFAGEELADHLEIPVRLVWELLDRLCRAGVLTIVQGENDRDLRYQPARDVNEMSVQFVIEQLDKSGTEDIPMAETVELERIREALHAFDLAAEHSPENVLLKDLIPSKNSSKQNVPHSSRK